jgi:hypothetical protein
VLLDECVRAAEEALGQVLADEPEFEEILSIEALDFSGSAPVTSSLVVCGGTPTRFRLPIRTKLLAMKNTASSPRPSLFGGSATEISARRAHQPTTAAWSNLSKLVSMATRSLFLDDHGALFGLCDRVGCGLGLLPAGVVFGLAFAVVDVPHVVFLIDPDW